MSKSKLLLVLGSIAVTIVLLFCIIFISLQQPAIYGNTLAKISHNYERVSSENGFSILWTKKPYVQITEQNSYHWDGKLYRILRDSLYANTDHFAKERLAYYPMFPLIWKITLIDSTLIFIFNYLLFVSGLLILAFLLMERNTTTLLTFSVALLLPSAIVYYLPYAESLFLFTFALAVAGLMKKKYWLFFISAFAFSMIRPASQIFFFALIAADFRYFFQHRQVVFFFRELIKKILPLGLGIFTVVLMQRAASGSWNAYFEADSLWVTRRGFFNPISDWSYEGFGMTVFAILFLAIPCVIYSVSWGLKTFTKNESIPTSLFSGNELWIKAYLFNTAVLFIAGNLLYTFLHSGNEVNGFYRYTMSVPSFYVILFLIGKRIETLSLKTKLLAFFSCIVGMIIFFSLVYYGESRFRFSYSGLYLSICFLLFLIIEPHVSTKNKIVLLLALLLPALIWHSYLFNMYLCNGWIYT